MGFLDRLLGNDHQRAAEKYAGRESASDQAARKRREKHRARVLRDGDNAGTQVPRRHRRHDNGASN
ncbi:hypothetical protein [Streptomyces sp. F-1]|uniref:hypothetical protein n=1 Tax=Streptomyces sp. F-1 TaxID=463642 RepID=UPI00085BD151|nr:hypothetical protein [Streptomyces sp. F-1]SFY52075.1 hypothetical protein STEPF1_05344 [Streptomyces sp. F-1]